MGTTFGEGNIKKTQKGKWAVTLVDKKSRKAVRVTPKAGAMFANKQTSFIQDYREKDNPASKVTDTVVDPLIRNVMSAPDDKLLSVSRPFAYDLHEGPHSFDGFVCEECGEMTVMQFGGIKGDKKVCIDRAVKS